MQERVCIIGAGIFGVSLAVELKGVEVIILEKSTKILSGATYANHNRHHYGFHYPRSKETAYQCLASKESFEGIYKEACVSDFDNYYCISKTQTKTTPEDYLKFCRQMELPFEQCEPPKGLINRDTVDLCLKVTEPVYDFEALYEITQKRLEGSPHVKLRLGHEVIGVKQFDDETKVLSVSHNDAVYEISCTHLVNATYGNYNEFCHWLGIEKSLLQYNIQELNVIELPLGKPAGVTIQDGPFPSFLPIGRSLEYLLAHVETSQLRREVSESPMPLMRRTSIIKSNWEQTQEVSAKFLPILAFAKYKYSLFVDRVVDGNCLIDDARISAIKTHHNRIWSIFSAKVITCIETANRLKEIMGFA